MVLPDVYSRVKFHRLPKLQRCAKYKTKNKETNKTKQNCILMTQYNLIFMPAFDLVKQTLEDQDKFN